MGYLDGKLLTEWKGDWKDLNFPEWVSRTQLEIATYSATVFHSIEVLEVTGNGTGFGKAIRRMHKESMESREATRRRQEPQFNAFLQ